VKLLEGLLSMELGEGMSSVDLVKVADNWMWGNGRIDNTPEAGLGWFDKLVFEKVKDGMGNIGGGGGPLHCVIIFSGC
jgi:hypothetical protein